MRDILDGLTQPQARAAALCGPVLVLAGGGTGKTRTLTAAVAHRIAHDRIPSGRILAVTFTNKAAAEMLDRIRAAVGDEGRRDGSAPSTASARVSFPVNPKSPNSDRGLISLTPTTHGEPSSG
jgi:superfamily I DNA/RNA helicase